MKLGPSGSELRLVVCGLSKVSPATALLSDLSELRKLRPMPITILKNDSDLQSSDITDPPSVNPEWITAPYRVSFCFATPSRVRGWSRKRRLKWIRREMKKLFF